MIEKWTPPPVTPETTEAEAQERAKAREQNKGTIGRLQFWNKETGTGVLIEEAERMNAQIDAEKERSPRSSTTKLMETVAARSEFTPSSPEEIEGEEYVRKLAPDIYDNLKKNNFKVAFLNYPREAGEIKARVTAEEYEKFVSSFHNLVNKQLVSTFSGGNLEGMRSAMNNRLAASDMLLLIPSERAAKPDMQAFMADRLDNEVYSGPEKASELFAILKESGMLGEKYLQSERFKSSSLTRMARDLEPYTTDPEGARALIQSYADTGMFGDFESLRSLPEVNAIIQEKLISKLRYGDRRPPEAVEVIDTFVNLGLFKDASEPKTIPAVQEHFRKSLINTVRSEGSRLDITDAPEKMRAYASTGILGSFEDIKAYPEIQEHYMDRLLVKVRHGDGREGPEKGQEIIRRYAETGIIGTEDELKSIPAIREFYEQMLERKVLYGDGKHDPEAGLALLKEAVATGFVGTLDDWEANATVKEHYSSQLVLNILYGSNRYDPDAIRSEIDRYRKTGLVYPISELKTRYANQADALQKLGL